MSLRFFHENIGLIVHFFQSLSNKGYRSISDGRFRIIVISRVIGPGEHIIDLSEVLSALKLVNEAVPLVLIKGRKSLILNILNINTPGASKIEEYLLQERSFLSLKFHDYVKFFEWRLKLDLLIDYPDNIVRYFF